MTGPTARLLRSLALSLVLGSGSPLAASPDSPNPGSSMANPSKAHHTPEGFRNRYPHPPPGDYWAWQRERRDKGLPVEPPAQSLPRIDKPDVEYLKANRNDTTATWIGHATVLLQVGGLNLLTDPHLTERASPVPFAGPKRFVPPALDFEQLPKIDLVVISHSHYDHLDRETVVRLARQPGRSPRFFVGLGLARWFRDAGIDDVIELDWWDSVDYRGARVHFVPVQHWSQRTPWDRNRTLWGGWVVERNGFRFFFAGDAGYSKDFADIGERFGGFDLAALPIGAYAPRWFMQTHHVDPDEAYQAYRDLRAKEAMAIHWGTFVLTDEPFEEPAQRLAALVARTNPGQFHVYRHGETKRFR